jgi:hypothetical protein
MLFLRACASTLAFLQLIFTKSHKQASFILSKYSSGCATILFKRKEEKKALRRKEGEICGPFFAFKFFKNS